MVENFECLFLFSMRSLKNSFEFWYIKELESKIIPRMIKAIILEILSIFQTSSA